MASGATLIDIRSDAQVAADGVVPGAVVIARNVLEWRLDPASEHRLPGAPGLDEHIILMCNEGYQSSLAAATLQQLGFARATDLDGGFQAWRAAGSRSRPPAGSSSPPTRNLRSAPLVSARLGRGLRLFGRQTAQTGASSSERLVDGGHRHDAYGFASRTRLNGVSVARRKRVNPPAFTTSRRRASPAWAPSASPTSWSREAGVQTSVEAL